MKRVVSDALVLPGAASTPFSGWSKAKAALDRAVADARGASLAPWSVHDLRRTVATGLQRLGVRLEVTEAVLNHISGSRAGIAAAPRLGGRETRRARRVGCLRAGRSPTGNVVKLRANSW